jgi:hypothetical protein
MRTKLNQININLFRATIFGKSNNYLPCSGLNNYSGKSLLNWEIQSQPQIFIINTPLKINYILRSDYILFVCR